MSVQAILNEKGANVVTATREATVREACRLLHNNRIGAVVIVDNDDQIEGIFTERDVVAAVALGGAESMARPLREVMWTNVYCCTQDTSINELMEVMNKRKARHLPVEQNARLAGIVSIGDAVRHHIRAIEYEAQYIRSYIAG